MHGNASRYLADTVRRYLSAIGGAAQHVRRREQANCRNFLRFIDQEGRFDESTVGTWVTRSGSARSEVRRRRLSTVRRLVAMTPGPDAARLADWLDSNRQRLLESGETAKVVAIRSPAEDARQNADSCADLAIKFSRDGDVERAEALAKKALEYHPACLRAHALLGILKLEGNEPEVALEQFRQALVLSGDPFDRDGVEGIADVLEGLGRTLMSLGCLEEAFEVYDRLRRTKTHHALGARVALGHIAFLNDEVESAAKWFSQCNPLLQFNVYLSRSLQGERFAAAIALARALVANPFVPSVLLGVERRFVELIDESQTGAWDREARDYTDAWGELWLRWPGMIDRLRADWDSPIIRKFMMRATPVMLSTPTSPRLAVWIHRAATELQAADAEHPNEGERMSADITPLASARSEEAES